MKKSGRKRHIVLRNMQSKQLFIIQAQTYLQILTKT